MHNYSCRVAWYEPDGEYVATSAEFDGLSALAPTAEEAVRELRAAMEDAVAAFVEDGEDVPEPQFAQEYSGQFRLRVPKSLHAALVARADVEGVSLNTLVQMYASSGLAAAASSPTKPLSTTNGLTRDQHPTPPAPARRRSAR
jgi:predicted HicB family RNase H-like nuclease